MQGSRESACYMMILCIGFRCVSVETIANLALHAEQIMFFTAVSVPIMQCVCHARGQGDTVGFLL